MSPSPRSAIRLSAPVLGACFLVVSVYILLIGRRLDMPFAGGSGAGTHASAILLTTYGTASLPQTLARGETVSTNTETFASYQLNKACTVSLAEHSELLLVDGRVGYNVFNLLTGRAVAEGDCAFVTRETSVHTSGTTTLIHYSWLDELVVHVFSGETDVTQSGGAPTHITTDETLRFFTLPNNSHSEQAEFSRDESTSIDAFYSWSLR